MSRILFRPAWTGTSTKPAMALEPSAMGMKYVGFAAYHLPSGEEVSGRCEGTETALVVLGGRCSLAADDRLFEDVGLRHSVWDKTPPYAVLLPPGTSYRVRAGTSLHLVIASTPAKKEEAVPVRLIRPADIQSETRGEGQTARLIHHILPPSAPAARLQLVEVYTPAGNWSSFPPHKHDREDPPREAYLEEVYYYQIRPAEGFAFQRVYTKDGSLDEAVAARDGDLVAVPCGYHVVAAMPGYECYYLNVMAGPARKWNFSVDAAYAWMINWQKR